MAHHDGTYANRLVLGKRFNENPPPIALVTVMDARHALNIGGSSLVSTLAIRSSHATSGPSSRDPTVRRGSL